MRCLFCKKDSSSTKSVEHIIPESLGNKTLILPLGYVCDKCNNYFAREVEKPFLERLDMQLLRFQEAVPNKKNRIPIIQGLFNGEYPVKMQRDIVNGEIINGVQIPEALFKRIANNEFENMTITMPAFIDDTIIKSSRVVSRFLAKIALESLAMRLESIENSLDEIIDDKQFDPIRDHARLGTIKDWSCSIRRIYNIERQWKDVVGGVSQMIHESDFLLTNYDEASAVACNEVQSEMYFVIALWGMEFAINMGGPYIEGYEKWLKEHGNVSPLHYGKNKDFISKQ
ncbi:MAG: hypothetical protein K0S47_4660 [Herbinix sp.]|jgi:hypothetical protein|nr:hypothetical protein [Herbinix sp.]